jgi:hypothetical protein
LGPVGVVAQTPLLGLVECPTQELASKGKTVIDKLDEMTAETRGKRQGNLNSNEFLLDNSNLSSSSSSSIPAPKMKKNQKKPLTRLPFPNMIGPKCLRLVEVVNSVSNSCRRKKHEGRDEGEKSLESAKSTPMEGVPCIMQPVVEVVSPNPNIEEPQSGVDLILGGDFTDDMEEETITRNDPTSKKVEAEEIYEIQAALGINFHEGKQKTVERLIELEDRDMEKLKENQENRGFQ